MKRNEGIVDKRLQRIENTAAILTGLVSCVIDGIRRDIGSDHGNQRIGDGAQTANYNEEQLIVTADKIDD